MTAARYRPRSWRFAATPVRAEQQIASGEVRVRYASAEQMAAWAAERAERREAHRPREDEVTALADELEEVLV